MCVCVCLRARARAYVCAWNGRSSCDEVESLRARGGQDGVLLKDEVCASDFLKSLTKNT